METSLLAPSPLTVHTLTALGKWVKQARLHDVPNAIEHFSMSEHTSVILALHNIMMKLEKLIGGDSYLRIQPHGCNSSQQHSTKKDTTRKNHTKTNSRTRNLPQPLISTTNVAKTLSRSLGLEEEDDVVIQHSRTPNLVLPPLAKMNTQRK